jgi:hypothetical protein
LSWKNNDVIVYEVPDGVGRPLPAVKIVPQLSPPSVAVWIIIGSPTAKQLAVTAVQVPAAQPFCESAKKTVSRAATAGTGLVVDENVPPVVVVCMITPFVPTAQVSDPLIMNTDWRMHVQLGAATPLHTLPLK